MDATPLHPETGTLPRPFHSYPTQAVMPVARRPEQVFVRGQGAWLWDSTGRRHLDWVQGWAVNTLGHAPAELQRALATQSARLLQAGPGFHNEPAILLAAELVRLSGLAHAFLTSSGAEANEGAIKLARKWGQRERAGASVVLTFDGSFHGRTLATMAASGKPGFDRIFPPAVPGFRKLPFNDLAAVQAAIGPEVVAVMLEPLQGEAGVVAAEPGFVQGLRALCDAHGLLLIADEVQTGIGRCGTLFAHQAWGPGGTPVRPDILTLGKGLGGGVPLGAVLAAEGVCRFEPGDQGGTYGGNALMAACGLAMLQAVTAAGFLAHVRQCGEQLAQGLARLSARHGLGPVHGRGLLRALQLPPGLAAGLVADAARTGDAAADGLLVNPAQPARLRLMPPLNLRADELAHGLALLDAALARLAMPVA